MISISHLNDTDEIMNFIDLEWKKNHILSRNKEFFLYEYRNKELLNFIISKSEGKINGILGFLLSSSDDNPTVWTTMWKVSKSNGSPVLGLQLLDYLLSLGYKSVVSNGINPSTEIIYKYLGYFVGELNHYFIPNNKLKFFRIAKFKKDILHENFIGEIPHSITYREISTKELNQFFKSKKHIKTIPNKDYEYVKKRFYDHPIYNYKLYGVFKTSEILSIMIVRIVNYGLSSCLRIVDFYGLEETIRIHTANLIKKMYLSGFEYIDFLTFGLSNNTLKRAGFKLLNHSQKEIIIPNYFEPLVKKNLKVRFFSNTKKIDGLRIFKADGDQDRPSVLKK